MGAKASGPRTVSAFMFRVLVAALLALSGWMAAGVLTVSDTAARVRLGLLPPAWTAGLVALVVSGVLLWRRPAIRSLLPAVVVGLCLLPWVPLPVPAATLVWTGPLAILIWLGALVAGGATGAPPLPRWEGLRTPRTARRVAFVAALAIYASGYVLVSGFHPQGDEPHYLIISQSLLADGDLRIQNNHDHGEYADFFSGQLKPDYLRRGTNGEIYSIHAPGLAVLILPAYALLGMKGAVAFLILACAAGAALLWRTAYELTRDAGAAWMAWGGAALSVPFALHSFAIFPDAPASVLVLIGLHALVRASRHETAGLSSWLLVGAALAGLPWLHTRYALLAGVLGLALVITLVRQPRSRSACVALLTVPIASALGWFGCFWAIYGTPNPSAPYGGYTQTAMGHILPGVTGLLFDAQFGAIATAPILAWSAVGIVKGAFGRGDIERGRGVRLMAVTLLALCLPYLVASGAYRMWWGGASAPARFVVPLVLPLGLGLAFAWAAARTRATRALMVAAVTVSTWLLIVMLTVDGGRLAYNDRDGVAIWAAWASPAVDLARALPSIHRGRTGLAIVEALAWIGAAVVAWVALRAVERRSWADRARFAVLAAFAAAVAIMSAVTVSWAIEAAQPGRPASQALLFEAVGRWPRGHGVVLDGSASLLPRARWVGASDFVSGLRIPGVDRSTRLELPPLPPGRYQLEATSRVPIAAPLMIRIGRERLPAATWDLSTIGAGMDAPAFNLTFPVAVPRWSIEHAQGSRAVPLDVRVHPIALLRPAGGLEGMARQAVAYGPFLAFFMDAGAYPEPGGFWIGPHRDVTVVVGHPDATSSLRVMMRNVPVENRVDVAVGKWRDSLTLAPGATRAIVTPPPGSTRATVLRLRASAGARPSSLEPGNRDHRELAVWVQLER